MASTDQAQVPDTVLSLDPLLQIRRSNKLPTPQERHLTRHQIDGIDEELQKAQREIDMLQLQLAQLQARITFLKEEKEEYLAILSPWRGLPTDILAEILQIAVNPGSTSFLSSTNHPTDRRHFKNLRAVCQIWRDVAFSTQSLWTSVWVNFDDYPVEEIPAVIRGVQSYFGRSGSAWPLELGFKWQEHPENPHASEGDGQRSSCLFSGVWLAYLLSQRTRLREVSIYASPPLLESLNARLRDWAIDGEVWNLEFLLIHLHRRRLAIGSPDPSRTVPVSFPKLKSLSFAGTASALRWDVLRGHSNLSIMRLTIDDINILLPTLAGAPCLEELHVTFSGVASEQSINGETTLNVHVPYLRRLSLACFPSFSLLSKLQAPILTNLYLFSAFAQHRCAGDKRRLWGTFAQVIDFIKGTGRKLESFYLDSCFIQDDQVLGQLFSALSSIKTLCTDTWCDNLGIFQSRDTSAYFPQLTSLCIHLPHEIPFRPSSSLDHMTSPRGWQPNRWRSLGAFLKSRSMERLATKSIPDDDPTKGGNGNEDQAELLVYLPEQARPFSDFEWRGLERHPGLDLRIVSSQWEIPGTSSLTNSSRSVVQPFASKYPQISSIPHPTTYWRKPLAHAEILEWAERVVQKCGNQERPRYYYNSGS